MSDLQIALPYWSGRAIDRHSDRILFLLINPRLFNTFQKHSADSKLSTNTYLLSVAAVFKKVIS